ncbi:hypothetical protein PS910_02292 [Pseudomonas fluorescens]|nr:hypothetical protein PS910_02292 [Pseudomonas fluorescens]
MKVFSGLKTRGVEDMLIAVSDGLKGRYRPAHLDISAATPLAGLELTQRPKQ